jgi:hypothetical protein
MSTPAANRVLRVVGAVLRNPGHLPLALWLLATLLYGTVAGALLHDQPYVAGPVINAIWVAATWRGLHLFAR